MTVLAGTATQVIEEYIQAINGKPKTDEIIDQFVSDPVLKEHIHQAEMAFPEYEIAVEQLVAEGDTVALRGTFHGTHQGYFAGVAPTGKHVSAEIMLFYRLDGGRIVKHWMVLDMMALLGQLSAAAS